MFLSSAEIFKWLNTVDQDQAAVVSCEPNGAGDIS